MLQSSIPENEELARSVGAAFLLKGSPVLLHQLREFIVESFGFGAFLFCMPDGSRIDRAPDLKSLLKKLETVPAESLGYHGERNHFSNWLKARGEFALAESLKPRKVVDYKTLEELRQDLIRSIQERLLPLGDDVTFIPGHGPTSTLGAERRGNPFLLDPDRYRGMV